MTYRRYFILLLLLLFSPLLQAQLLEDKTALDKSEQALKHIYNNEFTAAEKLIAELKPKYRQHPVWAFLQAYKISWQHMPISKGETAFTHYNQYLQLSLKYAQALLDKKEEDLEGTFFSLMVYGLLALHEAESGDFFAAVGYGKKSFKYMKRGFELTERFAEFHFSSGLYRYFAVQYPETHPIVKPFMGFFPGGNKTQGLWHLQQASLKSRFARVEALVYMNDIYAKYESNYLQALNASQRLVNEFPKNQIFWVKYCENLIQVGRYAEAEIHLKKFAQSQGKIYQIATNTFRGILQEKYYKNTAQAKTYYQKAIAYKNYDPRYSKNYVAFAYAGLARIAKRTKQTNTAKKYYKEVLKLSEYEETRQEAERFIKG